MLRRKLAMMISVLQEATELVKEFFGYPLTVLKGLQDNLVDYKIYGNSEQQYISIAGSTFKIPDGYTLLESAGSNSNDVIIVPTGVDCLETDKVILEAKVTATPTQSGACLTSATDSWIVLGMDSNWYARFGSGSSSSAPSSSVLNVKHTYSLYKNNFDIDNVSVINPVYTSISGSWYILSDTNAQHRAIACDIYSYLIQNTTDNSYRFIGVPMKNSSNVVGFYDFITNTFKIPTTGTFTAGSTAPTPSTPIEIKSVGDKSSNLVNMNDTPATNLASLLAITKPTRCTANVAGATQVGTPIAFSTNANALAIPCTKERTYSVKYFGTISTLRKVYTEIDSSGNVLYTRQEYLSGGSTITTTNDNCAFLLVEWSLDAVDEAQMVIVEGSTIPTEYIPGGYKIPVQAKGYLPDGYKQVEYIQNSGTQYIDTGVTLTNTSVTDITLLVNSNTTASPIFGYRGATNIKYALWASSSLTVGFNFGSVDTGFINESLTQKCTITMNSTGFYKDGTLIRENTNTATFTTGNAYLFASNDGGSPLRRNISVNVYGFKISDNGVVLFNGIPAIRTSDNEAGLYDLVSNTFKTNAGTGTFVTGDEIATPEDLFLPDEYTRLSYLQGTGIQYIDTGVSDTNGVKVKGKIAYTDLTGYQVNGAEYNGGTRSYPFGTSADKWYLGSHTYTIGGTVVANQIYEIEGSSVVGNAYLKVDGTTVLTITNSTAVTDKNLYLFASNGYAGKCKMIVYDSMQYYNSSGVLVRNFIPAKRNSDGELGMYDTVTGTFFTNQGTGTFIGGAEIPTITTTTNIYLNEPLRKVGDNIDYLDFQNGKVYRNVGEYVLDGTETFSNYASSNVNQMYATNKIISSVSGSSCYSNIVPYGMTIQTRANSPYLGAYPVSSATNIAFNIYAWNSTMTAAEWKTWVGEQYSAGTPVKAYYQKATPTEETVTLPSIGANKGITEYTVGTEVKPYVRWNYYGGASSVTWTQGYLMADGTVGASPSWDYTDFVPVYGVNSVTLSRATNTGTLPALCGYDENKNLIASCTYATGGQYPTITSGQKIYYVKFNSFQGERSFFLSAGTEHIPYNSTSISPGMYAKAKVSEL